MFRLAAFLKPYKKETILGPLFKLLEAILELLLPTIVALTVNHGIGNRDSSYVLKMGVLMLAMTLLGYGSSLICQYYAARASQGFGTTLRNRLFRHVSSLSFSDLERFGTPSLINRVTNDVNQLQVAVAMLIRLVIRAPFICIGAIIMAMILDLRLSLILLAATPIFGIVLYWIIAKSAPLYRLYQKKLDKLVLVLSESLGGVRVIRAFAKRREEQSRFKEAADDITVTAIRVGRISALLSPLTMLVVNAAIIAILWAGGVHINQGSLSSGEIIAFINYVTQILLALIVVSNLIIIFTKAASSAARINELLDTYPTIIDGSADVEYSTAAETKAPLIEFDHVSFGYSSTGDPALKEISFKVHRGETIGIIGGTGSGKSSLIHLIPRFYDTGQGAVYVEGTNVMDYSLEKLRSKVALVPQKAILFTGTVADNIRWSNEHAGDQEVAEAARAAQAEEFINKLPEGYQTRVARGGLNLSGGQKQRITIARALLARSEILILDDSSSALDYATEAALRRSIRQYHADTTMLLVTQRVSTVLHADRIIVLEEGRIAGIGTHEELLKHCEPYREICRSQLSEGEGVQG
ncbi:multidrug ABC transporter ATP-binding protein [Paenibacillus antibioticophila]|uniref:Multidrug ABC transporter ATP-binding protein n=1 Tax=Paenibacillus antibioticophila TaxID=1274374 RepID=A0A919XR60_9BACL|nr:ABC transporter ATP-binding protein [Paenibacillus antibioticophila]GIO36449.1 multidrug ABC transporter ATP-binding protein [Paenibacillus antibioticophila]